MTPKTPKKSMSSTSRGCQPVSRFCRARYLPRTTNSTKPAQVHETRTSGSPAVRGGRRSDRTADEPASMAGARSAPRALLESDDYTREREGWPMPNNRRSRIITQGVARSPNRAMLRAVGFGDGDFDKPIVGVANGHSTMNPCNAGIQPLVDRAMAALHDAGRDAAGVRLSDRHRRHRHGHRGHEIFARVARGDRRRDRSRGQRPVHGRRASASAAATRTCPAA